MPALLLAAAAASLVASAPAAPAASLDELQAMRAALGRDGAGAAAASGGLRLQLPLPEAHAASVSRRAPGLASLARSHRPARVLIGLRSHADGPALKSVLRGVASRVRTLEQIGVLAVSARSPARLAARLRDDPRVAYLERDRVIARVAADPADAIDPETGVRFSWAYEVVHAAPALAAAGGGSKREVAIIDTGIDAGHPDLAGRVALQYDTATRARSVSDLDGHGTFIAGLISAVDGNGIGGKGVAGNTPLFALRASLDGKFTVLDFIDGMLFAIDHGADVLNMSLAGDTFSLTEARALELSFFADVLPVAPSGNNGDNGNPVEYPGAAVGGRKGGRGIGLSVAAIRPDGSHAPFSTFNQYVSLAAPGAGRRGCRHGVYSSIPRGINAWDTLGCPRVFGPPGGDANERFAYGEGTSFSAPVAAGIAALVWQVEHRLQSEQVAHVMIRSARQTLGSSWNQRTGSGVVDGAAAVAEALRYDVSAPRRRVSARRLGGNRVRVRIGRSRDRTLPGRELAGKVRYSLFVSRDNGRSYERIAGPRSRPFRKTVRLRGKKRNVVGVTACDRLGNCSSKRLRYRVR